MKKRLNVGNLLVLALVMTLVGAGKMVKDGALLAVNYADESGPAVFQRVTGAPLPVEASGLKVAGHSFFIKNWVWMTFHVTDKGWRELTAHRELDNGRVAVNYCANKYFEQVDKQSVGWVFPTGIPAQDCYGIGNYDDGIDWSGSMAYDRKSKIVYLHAGD